LIWFSSEAFGFFELPPELTTGSSIMPQKRNPDILELVRALPASMSGRYVETTSILQGLLSGYHRDLQRTKKPLILGLREMAVVLDVLNTTVTKIKVNEAKCAQALEEDIYATDHVYAHVRMGMPFRDAYRAAKNEKNCAIAPEELFAQRSYPWEIAPDKLHKRLDEFLNQLDVFAGKNQQAIDNLA
jgi:argininosuccinate lyase